jgi:hypothetical protein
MEFLNLLPKKLVENIQNNYNMTSDIQINGMYAIYRDKEFIEDIIIKNIMGNDVHLFYRVKTFSRDYNKNEIVPIDKTMFFIKKKADNEQNPMAIKMNDPSKKRLKNFFCRNYIKK